MQIGRQARVRAGSGVSAPDPNAGLFAATLAQNAGLNGRVKLPAALGGAIILRSIQIVSADQLDWELWFWGNKGFQSGHPDLDDFRGYRTFSVAGGDGKRIGGAGLYYYYVDGLQIFYEDGDAGLTATVQAQLGAFLNVTLVNRSAGAKTVNAWFDLTVNAEPMLGY